MLKKLFFAFLVFISLASNFSEAGSCLANKQIECPTGWSKQFVRCYYFNLNMLAYDDADTYCKSMNATIMIARNIYELKYAAKLFSNATAKVYVGAKAIAPRNFYWSDGTQLSRNSSLWYPGDPDNYGINQSIINEGCVIAAIASGGKEVLIDVFCGYHRYSICEKPLV